MTSVSIAGARRYTIHRGSQTAYWIGLIVVSTVLYVLFRGEWTIPHEDETAVFDALLIVPRRRRGRPPERTDRCGPDGDPRCGRLVRRAHHRLPARPRLGGRHRPRGDHRICGRRVADRRPVAVGFLVIAALGLWDSSMETLGLTLGAVILSLVIGIPLGILAGRNDRVRAAHHARARHPADHAHVRLPCAVRRCCSASAPPAAAIVTLIYAMPAAIRITALGIRGVPATTIEASRSLGRDGPSGASQGAAAAGPASTIGLAVNQTIMLALSMVVVTVAHRRPRPRRGHHLRALERLDVGAAFEAGLAIVILAIDPRPGHRARQQAHGPAPAARWPTARGTVAGVARSSPSARSPV